MRLVQQVFRPHQPPSCFGARPRRRDRRRIVASLDSGEPFGRPIQARVCFDLELAGKQLHQRARDLDADAHRPQRVAIGDDDEDAAAVFVRELAGRRREPLGIEAHAGKIARVERVGEPRAVNPWRADVLERRVGAAADREVGVFERADARIQASRHTASACSATG